MASLFELTSHEAGIIVYEDGSIAVTNWVSLNDAQIPLFHSVLGQMGWPCADLEGDAEVLCNSLPSRHIDDIRTLLPGKYTVEVDEDGDKILDTDMDVVSDCNNDLPALWGFDIGGSYVDRDEDGNLVPTSGRVWEIGGATVIAPDMWN